MAATMRRPKPITIYFTVAFDRSFDSFGGWKDGKLIPIENSIEGQHTGVYVNFKTQANEIRLMKVAISYVSVDEAKKNMQAELPHWDFDRVVKESYDEWNKWLERPTNST